MSYRLWFILCVCMLFAGEILAQTDTLPQSDGYPFGRQNSSEFPTDEITITADSTIYASAATQDSILQKQHSPSKAVLLSLFPGAGQIYNKKWWKVPIIYAGLGVSAYFIYDNAVKAVAFRNEDFFRQYNATEYFNPNLSQYPTENLAAEKNKHLRNMEIAAAAFVIVYALNLIDALVDAHLFNFDISDDLSLNIAPMFDNKNKFGTFSTGLALKLNF